MTTLTAARHKATRLIQSGRIKDGDLINDLLDRIAELEAEIHSLKHDPMTVQYYNQIQAEGIREMLQSILDARDISFPPINCKFYGDEMLKYADKLESKDE